MVRVQIEVQHKGAGWRIKFCTIYLHDRVLIPIAITDRPFGSQYAAVKDMRRQVLDYLTLEGHLDSAMPIDWQILPWEAVQIETDRTTRLSTYLQHARHITL